MIPFSHDSRRPLGRLRRCQQWYLESSAKLTRRKSIASRFEEYSRHYSDWPALAAFYERMSDLAKTGEIVVAEVVWRDNLGENGASIRMRRGGRAER